MNPNWKPDNQFEIIRGVTALLRARLADSSVWLRAISTYNDPNLNGEVFSLWCNLCNEVNKNFIFKVRKPTLDVRANSCTGMIIFKFGSELWFVDDYFPFSYTRYEG